MCVRPRMVLWILDPHSRLGSSWSRNMLKCTSPPWSSLSKFGILVLDLIEIFQHSRHFSTSKLQLLRAASVVALMRIQECFVNSIGTWFTPLPTLLISQCSIYSNTYTLVHALDNLHITYIFPRITELVVNQISSCALYM